MKNYTLTTEHSFDSAHFLHGHNGQCRFCHGHRWKVVLKIKGNNLHQDGSSRGMIMDFTDMKREFKSFIDSFDHSLIIESPSGEFKEQMVTINIGQLVSIKQSRVIEVPFRPTAENFSEFFYKTFKHMGYPVSSVTVFETPTNGCEYAE